jgi:hypothetical protein
MSSDDEHTLVFKAVSGVSVRAAGETVAIEFATPSAQSVTVLVPAEASHMLSRMLMRAQIEAAAERGLREEARERAWSSTLPPEHADSQPEPQPEGINEAFLTDFEKVQT